MNNKSVIDNPKRLTALLKEKIAYDEYKSDDYSVLHGTLENVARLNRVEILYIPEAKPQLHGLRTAF